MFPWMMPNATTGGNLSLLSMMMGSGAQSPYGNMYQDPQAYWNRVGATRQPGEDNSQVWFRGLLPQSMWPDQWKSEAYGYNGDRSDQTPQGNQPDTGNSMAPPGQRPSGGPDNTPMSPYDPNTVAGGGAPSSAYGYQPSPLMRAFSGAGFGGNLNRNQQQGALQLGRLGLNMMYPQQRQIMGPLPWMPIAGSRY